MKLLLLIFMIFPFSLYSIDTSDWLEVKPGGETRCSRGGEFSFFVQKGDPSRVVIDFFGGGACWSKKTCKLGSKIFIDSIEKFMDHNSDDITGYYDKKNEKNPIKDWTHVVIPYCTGDIHVGENDHVYGKRNKKFTINHRGAINVKAVLKHVEKKYLNVDKILMAGCSAGAYGSIYWLPHVKDMYPNSKIYQFADSGAGVITGDFFMEHATKKWDVWKNIPQWILGSEPSESYNLVKLYQEYGDYYPDVRLSQFNFKKDVAQRIFYRLMGGKPFIWHRKLDENLAKIDEPLENFNSYLAGSGKHCVLPFSRFYKTKVDGVLLTDWLKKLINDETLENRGR